MLKQTYELEATVFCTDGKQYRGRAKVNDCLSEIEAKDRLEAEMKKRYPKFMRMVVNNYKSDIADRIFEHFRK